MTSSCRAERTFAISPAKRSATHDKNPVANSQELRQFGRHDDDDFAQSYQFADEEVHLVLGADVDSARRFIENDDLRIRFEPPRDQQFLLIATR